MTWVFVVAAALFVLHLLGLAHHRAKGHKLLPDLH